MADEIITTKEAVKALFRECGGHKAVAHELDVSLARVYSFTDPASPDHNLTYKRVAQLTERHGASAAARDLAQRAGGVFIPLPTMEAATTVAAVGEAVKHHGACIAETLAALGDGKITPDEVPPIVKKIDEAFAALATLRGLIVQGVKQ